MSDVMNWRVCRCHCVALAGICCRFFGEQLGSGEREIELSNAAN